MRVPVACALPVSQKCLRSDRSKTLCGAPNIGKLESGRISSVGQKRRRTTAARWTATYARLSAVRSGAASYDAVADATRPRASTAAADGKAKRGPVPAANDAGLRYAHAAGSARKKA